MVYHYTRAATLTGLLSSQRFRATMTSHLNDTTELAHASDLFRGSLRRRAAARATTDFDLYPGKLTDYDYAGSDLITTFVASFSGAEDHLPQWCMYGDSFAGVALGFYSAAFVRLDAAEASPQPVGFFRVQYLEHEQSEMFDWLVEEWERHATDAWRTDIPAASNRRWLRAWWYSVVAVGGLSLLPRMKSEYFGSEREWRLAHLHNRGRADCPVLASNGKPYVALDASFGGTALPLASVWLGPAVSNDGSEELVRALLTRSGYSHVPVLRSRIPLRREAQLIAL